MRYVLVSLLVAACAVSLAADVIERILVKVNGDIITHTDLEDRQIKLLRERNTPLNPEDLESDAALRKVLAEITPELIVVSVDELLLVQRGRELGYAMGDEQFEDMIANIKKENNIESDLQWEAALSQEGMTLSDLRGVLERQYLVGAVQQVEILSKISITDTEASEYYDTHLKEFNDPASVTLREILVRVPSSGPNAPGGLLNVGLDEEARQKAEAARARIVAGEDFATVAAEFSDAPSKANGGLIGPVNRSELALVVLELVEGLSVGDVSEVTRTTQGYQCFKLESETDAAPRPFEEVRDRIANNVFNDRRLAAYDEFLDKLRTEAIIEWKDETLQKAYEQWLGQLRSGTQGSL